MNTTIYFIRHSEPLKIKKMKYSDNDQLNNEKQPLTVDGENKAKILSEVDELSNIDVVISSNYVRTISTAKYIAEVNNLDLYINEDFKERRHGVNWDELPYNYEIRQFYEENYKLGDGESQKEVRERMNKALTEVLEKYKGKRIAIISHGTAMTFLFRKWCEVDLNSKYLMKFNDKVIFDKKWDAPELFKLIFDEKKELISIENIRVDFV